MSLRGATAVAARRFVSRGGEKLDGALDRLGLDVTGARALDAGASTGGFTDCLLRRGARAVLAVDVAYGELAWELRTDPRVVVLERTNVRDLDATVVGEAVDLVTADLAFISLRTAADAFEAVVTAQGWLLLLVKPQFELPRAEVPHGGVVRDPAAWAEAVGAVVSAYRDRGWRLAGAAPSALPGPKGNREFFVHFSRTVDDAGDEAVARAIAEAP